MAEASPKEHWQAEYEFWHKIITGEVERLRFNDGYEPVELDLYPLHKAKGVPGPDYIGTTRIGHQKFRASGRLTFDSDGNQVLRIRILLLPRK